MSEKLTLEWCFKYPKARIREYGLSYNTYLDEYDNLLCMLKIYDAELWEKTQNCKLILRPLSSLTDEERNYLSEIDFKTEHKDVDIYNGFSVWGIHITTTDYLRSINIDIDGLQEQGKAIYE